MKKLVECIDENTTKNKKEISACITGMVCSSSEPIPLEESKLLTALNLDGEFFVLKLHYDDFENELKDEKIKYKISQALSVMVTYEDDGDSFEKIEQFIKYIYGISDDKQNSTFGVKKVDKLSEFPITILFSGILPINQLSMTVGVKIDKLIHSDDKYFVPRFQKHRDAISKEIGVSILPVLPRLDEKLDDNEVCLSDLMDGRIISKFKVDEVLNRDIIDIYLLKLFCIYKVLAQDYATIRDK